MFDRIRYLVLMIVYMAVPYALIAILTWEFNPGRWGVEMRIYVVFATFMAGWLYYAVRLSFRDTCEHDWFDSHNMLDSFEECSKCGARRKYQ